MRILVPILGFARQGGYRVLSELANTWARNGHECVFLAPSTSAMPYFPTTARILYVDPKGNISDLPGSGKITGLGNLLCLFKGLKSIGRDCDIVFANHSLTAWPVRWADCGTAKKIYYIQAYEPAYYSITKSPAKYLLSKLSYVLDLIQITNASNYKSLGLKPVDCIPPGIDLSVFTRKQECSGFQKNDTIILGTIGRTEPYKGTATALAAYRQLNEKDGRFRMKVGFGNVDPASDLEIIDIKGDEALAAYYRSVDILLVTCKGQHGAPHYPLIEAMASGTPVVHTGYFPGSEANSWPTTDTSTEATVQAVCRLLAAPDISNRVETARADIERELSWEAVAQRFLSHF